MTHDNRPYRFYIPKDVMDVFNDEFNYSDTLNWKELTDFAVAVLVGLTAIDTALTGGGGGGASNDNGWHDRKDEDEIERAKRCAHAAASKIGRIVKVRTQTINRMIMAKSKKFNHDDDFDAVQNEPQKILQSQKMNCPLEDTILRQTRLMERNNNLASEFRKLKPEIARCHSLLEVLNDSTGAFAGTMLNLHDLLKSSFPIRFSQEAKEKLRKELNTIADNLIEAIRKESDRAIDRVHKRERQLFLSPAYFRMMAASIAILALFFILVTYANIEILHNYLLTRLIVLTGALLCYVLAAIAYTYYKYKR